jgi:acyl carrier protein
MELWIRIRDVLSEELNVSPAAITDQARLREDLSIDSITALNLLFRLERDFGVRLSEEELVALRTVGELKTLVQRRSGGSR